MRSGKVAAGFLKSAVLGSLGAPSDKVVVGPGLGFDNAVVSLGGGKVLIATVDPVSVVPRLGMKLSAWLSVHLLASDFATSGVPPQFATFSYSFPPALAPDDARKYLKEVGAVCASLGVSIVAGHTGSYPGSGFTVVGSGSMLGVARSGGYLTPAMARPGDSVVMTKHAGLEAAAYLALSFPGSTDARVGRKAGAAARRLIGHCSTVADSLQAARVGLGADGVTTMHDATEGGVVGGLSEMANASGCSFEIDFESVPVSPESSAVCRAFGLDPLMTLSEGALLLTCSTGRADELVERLGRSGIPARVIGRVREGSGLWLTRGGAGRARLKPTRDSYWDAFSKAAAAGLE